MTEPTVARRVRLRIYQRLVEHAVPPVVEQLMAEFSLFVAPAPHHGTDRAREASA